MILQSVYTQKFIFYDPTFNLGTLVLITVFDPTISIVTQMFILYDRTISVGTKLFTLYDPTISVGKQVFIPK